MGEACPECGKRGVPLLYGKPGQALQEAVKNGDAAVVGSRPPPGGPNRQCPERHRWNDPDTETWRRELEEAVRRQQPSAEADGAGTVET